MTYFLVVYDRASGRLATVTRFDSEEEARQTRLGLEIDYRRQGRDVEVVLLQAEDLESLMRTHSRYFSTASHLIESLDKVPA